MVYNKRVVVVMPSYNAAKTVAQTTAEIDRGIVDEVILVDDRSSDDTVRIAKNLNVHLYVHDKNLGYGGNQKTCYNKALAMKADIIVMLHPDYQYTPKLLPALVYPIAAGVYDCMLGSRIIGKTNALKGGMPVYKYVANRFLTLFQNILIGAKFSEYHTGYRAFSAEILKNIPFEQNSNDFIFDNEILCQIHHLGYRIGEVSCPTKYFPEASTIGLSQSIKYGLGVLYNSLCFRLHRWGIKRCTLFKKKGGT
ncbi:glycosyltransferase family 2 protein [candidate division KSB1 bacterium]|nr:glycosyltransferase family 2 protein [candidate division KSB1 bacterium]